MGLLDFFITSKDKSPTEDENLYGTIFNDNNLDNEEKKDEDGIISIKKNIIERLNYLEEYIKTFSLMFPEEYKKYYTLIDEQKKSYNSELSSYIDAIENNTLTFYIDPEEESNKLSSVIILENEIKRFVESEVIYQNYIIKLQEFCNKINILYNVVLEDGNISKSKIISQVGNAIKKLEKLISEFNSQYFFENDNRKKNYILEYVFYANYMFFKLYLRGKEAVNFYDFRKKVEIDDLFEDYDDNVIKYIIIELSSKEIFLNTELKNDKMFNFIIEKLEDLKAVYIEKQSEIYENDKYFEDLIKFENTIFQVAKSNKKIFNIELPESLANLKISEKTLVFPLKKYTITILDRIISEDNDYSAIILKEILSRCKQITYLELYFMCKIFKLDTKVIEISENESFSNIPKQFKKISMEYPQYTDDNIEFKKNKILKSKKKCNYMHILDITNSDLESFKLTLNDLKLDYYINNYKLYLNSIYFNGFKNIIV